MTTIWPSPPETISWSSTVSPSSERTPTMCRSWSEEFSSMPKEPVMPSSVAFVQGSVIVRPAAWPSAMDAADEASVADATLEASDALGAEPASSPAQAVRPTCS